MRKGIVLFIVVAIIVVAIMVVPPIIWPKVFTTLNNISKGSITLILNLLELFGLILAFALVLFVFYQLFRYYLPRRFVFEGFSNESELISAELKPLYLSKLAWEELADQSQTFNPNLKTNLMGLLASGPFVTPPQIKVDLSNLFVGPGADILDWVKSAEGKIPKEFGLIMSIMSFLGAIIPPPVVKIDCHLQRLGGMPGKVGITFEIVDIKKQRTLMRTIWQDEKIDKSELIQWYKELLHPTMRWLVLECSEQKMMSDVPLINRIRKDREKSRQQQILYFLGERYYASAEELKTHEMFFLHIAADHFYMASGDLDWYLRDLNLANLYISKMQETEGELYETLLNEALSLYDKALRFAETREEKYNQARIRIAKALAELVSGVKAMDESLINKAIQEVEDMKTQMDPADFDPHRVDCAGYLYNLATWYQIAYDNFVDVPNVVPRDEARRYLAYSLARSPSLRNTVENDKNFKSMRDEGDLEILKKELEKKLSEERKLATMTGDNFKNEIGLILVEVDQMLGRPGR